MRASAPVGMPLYLSTAPRTTSWPASICGESFPRPSTSTWTSARSRCARHAARSTQVEEDIQRLARQRPIGTFARQLTLGYDVADYRIEADYADGVLTLKIPVAEEAKPRKIAVRLGAGSRMITGDVERDSQQD